ncbi:Protein IMPACT [Trichoplax sp. H2]|nr:Protein IMPACT [Trichoplax sp. H2]|eukprot:RDD44158.1 Protein IMPACT [Trichoplax sp. H2]
MEELQSVNDHNELAQKEELEALASIYGDDWSVIDGTSRIYVIRLQKDYLDSVVSIELKVLLPVTYPTDNAPEYELTANFFSEEEHTEMCHALDTIYNDSGGEVILFQWVEKLRECLAWKIEKENSIIQRRNYVASGSNSIDISTVYQSSGSDNEIESKLDETDNAVNSAPSTSAIISKEENPEIIHGEPIVDRKSVFQAHLAVVKCVSEVARMKDSLMEKRKIAHASHNVLAYRIINEEHGTYIQDCDDDGEKAAGSRLLHLLEILNIENVAVIVSRWYGGVLLGADRFKHYNNCARALIYQAGLPKVDKHRNRIAGRHEISSKCPLRAVTP